MSPSATPATQSAAATQNDRGCEIVPRLPRETKVDVTKCDACHYRGCEIVPPWFCVAGVALMALGGALGLVLGAGDAAALCVAGVALGDIYVRFTWQA